MAEKPMRVEPTPIENEQEEQSTMPPHETHSVAVPKGAIAFAVLMIIGYAFYFFMIWAEVVARGGQ